MSFYVKTILYAYDGSEYIRRMLELPIFSKLEVTQIRSKIVAECQFCFTEIQSPILVITRINTNLSSRCDLLCANCISRFEQLQSEYQRIMIHMLWSLSRELILDIAVYIMQLRLNC